MFISLDTLRADCIGANPLKLWPSKYECRFEPVTPLLDELVRGGGFFANCVSAAPYTSASHGTIFTGRWPLRHGAYEFFNRKLSCPTVFGMAKRLGYGTLFKVDFPIILGRFLGFDRDVDRYLVEDDDGFLAHLRAHERLVSFAHFGGIHVPYGFHNLAFGGQAYRDKVDELEAEIGEPLGIPSEQLLETYREPEDLRLLFRYKAMIEYHYARRSYDRLFEIYLEGVNFFMRHRFEPFMTRLLEALRGRRYLIVLFADHGEEYDADSFGHHNTLSEGVLRVPVLFLGPDVPPGQVLERVRTVDIVPTLLDRMGESETSADLDGSSLAGTIWGGEPIRTRPAYAQGYTSNTAEFVSYQKRLLATGEKRGSLRHVRHKEAVYDGDYKLVRQNYAYVEHGNPGSGLRPCEVKITLEKRNSDAGFSRHRDEHVQARLLAKLDAYNETLAGAGETIHVPEQIRRQLRDMGYRV